MSSLKPEGKGQQAWVLVLSCHFLAMRPRSPHMQDGACWRPPSPEPGEPQVTAECSGQASLVQGSPSLWWPWAHPSPQHVCVKTLRFSR